MLHSLDSDVLKDLSTNAVVAQLDRVPDYESGGRRFESSRPHHFLSFLFRNLKWAQGCACFASNRAEVIMDSNTFRPEQIFVETLQNRHPHITISEQENLLILAQEIGAKAMADFKPNENFFNDEDLVGIVTKASKIVVESTNSLDPSELLKFWNQAVVDFHRTQYWGFTPKFTKPRRPLTEDQKIRKELFSYIWVFFQSMIVLKTAVYFFGLEYADKREPINLFLLLAAIGTSFSSLIFFAYRKSRKQKALEEAEMLKDKSTNII